MRELFSWRNWAVVCAVLFCASFALGQSGVTNRCGNCVTTGSGTLTYGTISDTQVVSRQGSQLKGDPGLTYNASTDTLTCAGAVTAPVVGTTTNAAFVIETNDVTRATFAADGSTVTFTPRLLVPAGSETTAAVGFTGDAGTGVYQVGVGAVGFTTAGALRGYFSANGFFPSVPVRGANGSVGAPTFSFANETDSGMYSGGAGELSFAVDATLIWTVSSSAIIMAEAKDFHFGATTGTKIGATSAQKMAFWGATPVVRPAANADTSGATLGQLETEVNELKAMLRTVGLLTP